MGDQFDGRDLRFRRQHRQRLLDHGSVTLRAPVPLVRCIQRVRQRKRWRLNGCRSREVRHRRNVAAGGTEQLKHRLAESPEWNAGLFRHFHITGI
jgi:hypothetical protein